MLEADQLLDCHVHPLKTIETYLACGKKCSELLRDVCSPITAHNMENVLLQIATTAINSKLVDMEEESSKLAQVSE